MRPWKAHWRSRPTGDREVPENTKANDDYESRRYSHSRLACMRCCCTTEIPETHGCTDPREVRRYGTHRPSSLVRFVREEWNAVELFDGTQEDREVVDRKGPALRRR